MSRCCATCSMPSSRSPPGSHMSIWCKARSTTACISGRSARPRAKTIRAPIVPNFYYDQQDLLAQRAARRLGVVRLAPDLHLRFRARARTQCGERDRRLCGDLCRELGDPLDFPGSAASFDALRDMTDATPACAGDEAHRDPPACRNEAFNVVNGDVFRWRELWPRIAAHLRDRGRRRAPVQDARMGTRQA